MKRNTHSPTSKGFTVAELMIVIAVIAILATIITVGYNSMQQRAATATIHNDLKHAAEQVDIEYVRSPTTFDDLTDLPSEFIPSTDVTITYMPTSATTMYTSLTPVQNGVLFYTICEELILDSTYSTIHSANGSSTNSVQMRCYNSIKAESLLITGWDSRTWAVPVTKANIQAYMASVPYDAWWTDKQSAIRSFYQEMMDRHEARGGYFPITSFWDPWANEKGGVPKEELPPPSTITEGDGTYCIEAYHNDFPDTKYNITQSGHIAPGAC